jgi:hypothetical protein
MALYSGCFNTTVAGSAAPSMDFRAASANYPRIMEWGINLGAATASTYGIGRSSNSPTQTGTNVLLAEDAGNSTAGQTTQAVTWSVAPLVPANYFRRAFLPATIGAGIIFTFPRGLSIAPAAASMTLWNIAASAASTNIWVVADE